MPKPNSARLGALFVGLAAMLWATDALFRYPLVQHQLDPTFIVFSDHLIALALLAPFIFWKKRDVVFRVSPAQWPALALIGGGSSALATVLFVASFQYVNPSISILLQKFQPILVLLLASLFLGERPKGAFFAWAAVAFVAGFVMSFPDLDFAFLGELSLASKGSVYALSAASLWAIGTVLGKGALRSIDPWTVTFWRFAFGLGTLVALLLISEHPLPFSALREPQVALSLLYIAVFTGLTAMVLYYQGMKRISASTTTFLELLFPVSAVLVNTFFLRMPLSPVQALSGFVLLFAVTQISIANRG